MVTLTNRPTNLEGDYRAICLFEGSEIEGRDLKKNIYDILSGSVKLSMIVLDLVSVTALPYSLC